MTALLSRLTGLSPYIVERELRNFAAASVAGLWCVVGVWTAAMIAKEYL